MTTNHSDTIGICVLSISLLLMVGAFFGGCYVMQVQEGQTRIEIERIKHHCPGEERR